jgi:hypothetical protein
MTPQKRKKTNIQKILNRPVQSNEQHSISPKKEGFLGWMSYIGWALYIWLVLFVICNLCYSYCDGRVIFFVERLSSEYHLIALLSSVILPMIVFLKSPYRFLHDIIKIFLLTMINAIAWMMLFQCFVWGEKCWNIGGIILGVILGFIAFYCFGNKLSSAQKILCFMIVIIGVGIGLFSQEYYDLFLLFTLLILLLFGYLYYFYKKSKDGYRYVWLKVFLFSWWLFIPIEYKETGIDNALMGDPLYE